jgi:hypothetical protein
LNLLPWEFGNLTPREFWLLYDGDQKRKSDQEEMLARYVTNIVNLCGKGKKPYSIEDMLGRPLRANWNAALEIKDRKRRGRGKGGK